MVDKMLLRGRRSFKSGWSHSADMADRQTMWDGCSPVRPKYPIAKTWSKKATEVNHHISNYMVTTGVCYLLEDVIFLLPGAFFPKHTYKVCKFKTKHIALVPLLLKNEFQYYLTRTKRFHNSFYFEL